jgi:hypothetical protein
MFSATSFGTSISSLNSASALDIIEVVDFDAANNTLIANSTISISNANNSLPTYFKIKSIR